MHDFSARVNEIAQILSAMKREEMYFIQSSKQITAQLKKLMKRYSKSTKAFSTKRGGGGRNKAKAKKNTEATTRKRTDVVTDHASFITILLLFWCQLVHSESYSARFLRRTVSKTNLAPYGYASTSVNFKVPTIMKYVKMMLPSTLINAYDKDSREIHEMKTIVDLINNHFFTASNSSSFLIQEDCADVMTDKNVQRILENEEITHRRETRRQSGDRAEDEFGNEIDIAPTLSANEKLFLRQDQRSYCSNHTAAPFMDMQPTSEGIQFIFRLSHIPGGNYLELGAELRYLLYTLEHERATGNTATIIKIKKMLFMIDQIEGMIHYYETALNNFEKVQYTSYKIMEYYKRYHNIRVRPIAPEEEIDWNEALKIQSYRDFMTNTEAYADRNSASSNTQWMLAPVLGTLVGTTESITDVGVAV